MGSFLVFLGFLWFHDVAVGQNLRYLFGDDYPPKVIYFKGFWDVHRGTGVLTHCHVVWCAFVLFPHVDIVIGMCFVASFFASFWLENESGTFWARFRSLGGGAFLTQSQGFLGTI